MQHSIKLPKGFNLKYCKVKAYQFFLLSNKDYFLISNKYYFHVENNILNLTCYQDSLKSEFNRFASALFRIIRKNGKPFLKKLIFKGLGLRAMLIENNSILELKLGFSHLIRLLIPQQKIRVKIIKNGLLVFGNNLVSVCNFLYKIKKLKLPNIYKGKGIWYKNEVLKLKEIKKN